MRFAAEHGIHAAFFGVDSTRAEPDFYQRVYRAPSRRARRRSSSSTRSGSRRPKPSRSSSRATVELQSARACPVHFHGHNDFGVATARRVAAVRAGATWIHGTINGMGERAGNADLGEIALALRALYGVETNLRLDRIREVSARVQELSGYALEPWKPRDRRDAVPPRERRRREPVPRPAVDRAVLLGARRGRARDRARQEERARLDPDQGGGARPRRARGAAAELLAAVKGLGTAKRGLVTDDEFARSRRASVADYDAVIVGSGINSLACGALLARGGWSVCVLERNDWLGGAIKTAEITEPGFHHDVFCAWHPLWVGGAAHALLGDDLAARGLEYLNTELPTGDRVPGRRGGVPAPHGRRERRRARPPRGRRRSRLERRPRRVPRRTPTSRSACSAPSSGRAAGARSARRRVRRLGRRGLAEFAGDVLVSSRDWLAETFASERAHGLLAPWVLHTGLGPDAASSGFMTQVIAVAVQEGGMPVPRGGGARLADALVRLIEDNGGVVPDGRRGRVRARARRRRGRACAPPTARRSRRRGP